MDSSDSVLTPFQRDVLRALFAQQPGFFLTGGAALAEYYLHHRGSDDLDLFTTDDLSFAHGAALLEHAGKNLRAEVRWIRTAPQFRRGVVSREGASVVVDLVRDIDQQIVAEKPSRDGIRVDSIEDLTVNKLCALMGRQEVRDAIDLLFLERSGVDLVAAVPMAARKDGGMNAGILSQICAAVTIPAIPSSVRKPLSREELGDFLRNLSQRLARAAFPLPR